jgi:hypothetical protein
MKVTLTLATTTTELASGVSFGFYRFKVTGQADVDTKQTIVEYDLPAGAYSGSCQAYDTDGAPLGSTSIEFTVPADAPPPPPVTTYEAPAGLNVTFG